MRLVQPKLRPNPLTTKMFMDELKGFQSEPKYLKEFLETDEDSLVEYHHTYGGYIRNTYIYPTEGENTPEKRRFMYNYPDEHIDDISFEIIVNIHSMMKSLEKDGIDLYNFGKKEIK